MSKKWWLLVGVGAVAALAIGGLTWVLITSGGATQQVKRALELTQINPEVTIVTVTDLETLRSVTDEPVDQEALTSESRVIASRTFHDQTDYTLFGDLALSADAIATQRSAVSGSSAVLVGEFPDSMIEDSFTRVSTNEWAGGSTSRLLELGLFAVDGQTTRVVSFPVVTQDGALVAVSQEPLSGDSLVSAADSPEIMRMADILGKRSAYDMKLGLPRTEEGDPLGVGSGISLTDGMPRVTLLVHQDQSSFTDVDSIEDEILDRITKQADSAGIDLPVTVSKSTRYLVFDVTVDAVGPDLAEIYSDLSGVVWS